MNIRSGLVSVTFRQLPAAEIVEVVARAKLDGIEWGGDVHVPHGDLAVANTVGKMTVEAGLRVAAYGSYYRVGVSEAQKLPFAKVLETALTLQAPTVRVWAGSRGSMDVPLADRLCIVEESLRIGQMARQASVQVAFEFHRNTLTDTTESALALLQATQPQHLACYWQPTVGWSHAKHCDSLRSVLPYLSNLHVFQWDAGGVRQELVAGQGHWRTFLSLLKNGTVLDLHQPRWAMLEFVKDDSLEQFQRDAAVLKHLLKPYV